MTKGRPEELVRELVTKAGEKAWHEKINSLSHNELPHSPARGDGELTLVRLWRIK